MKLGRVAAVLLPLYAAALVLEPAQCRVLNDFIRHFEPLHYDEANLMWNHHRIKRSMVGPKEMELNFQAFGQSFNIILEPERDLFHPGFTLIRDGKRAVKHDSFTYMYSGVEMSDPTSRVYGNLAHGVFDGTVETAGGIYHVEPSFRYDKHLDTNDTFHSIIYRHNDMDTSSITGATCGSAHDNVHKTMLRLQHAGGRGRAVGVEEEGKGRGYHPLRRLRKRQGLGSNTRCPLRVVLDYKLYRELTDNREIPMAVIMTIILGGSSIFEDTDFDGDNASDGVNFSILQLIVEESKPPPTNYFANDFIGVSAFLNEHSQANYSAFCLSYRFTYRDFDGGVVGLAYIAPQPNENLRGGVCDRFSGGSTLNTGIVTSLNYGRRIPPSLSALTFAHEAGHNFGSQHDMGNPPADGAYIMHAFATDGTQPNNNRFSPESRTMMGTVITTRGDCFVDRGDNCGNMLLDEDEQCDCGPASNLDSNGVCRDNPCCFGRNCTLNSNVQCSPDQGPCCDASCMYIQESANETCSTETECAQRQICGGTSASCPDLVAKEEPEDPGFILCNNETGICNGPECNGTLCTALDLPDCECSNETQVCQVCCFLNNACISTIVIAERNINSLRAQLPGMMGRNRTIGTPCANFTGYCDIFSNCMAVDENGALFRLANLFFDSEALRQFLDFASERWWVLVIGAIGLLVVLFVMVMVIHCFLPRPKTVRSRNERRRSSIIQQQRRLQQQQQGDNKRPQQQQQHLYQHQQQVPASQSQEQWISQQRQQQLLLQQQQQQQHVSRSAPSEVPTASTETEAFYPQNYPEYTHTHL